MAYGDVGGPATELIITCKTPSFGTVRLAKGDAVKLTGAYTVDNATDAEDIVFGQALTAAMENDVAIPVKVRGICSFLYTGTAPTVDGSAGILTSATHGKVKAPATGNGEGLNLKVDTTTTTIEVLL